MSRRYSSSSDTTEICAFWAMVISGFAYLFGGIFNFICKAIKSLNGTHTASVLSSIYHIATFVGNIALIIAVALPAWQFVKYRSVVWKAIFWVGLIGFAFGAVLGMLGGLDIINW